MWLNRTCSIGIFLAFCLLATSACTQTGSDTAPAAKPEAPEAPEAKDSQNNQTPSPSPTPSQAPSPAPIPSPSPSPVLEDLTGPNLEKAVWRALQNAARTAFPSKKDITTTLDLLDYYNESMDLVMDDSQPESAYFERWDRQNTVMLAMQDWFQKADTTLFPSDLKSGPGSILNIVRHPYTLLYLLKADLNKPQDDRFFKQGDVDKRLDFRRRDFLAAGFFNALGKQAYFTEASSLRRILSKRYESLLHKSWPWLTGDDDGDTTVEHTVNAYKYRRLQYTAELTRLLLDVLSDDTGWSGAPLDRRRYLYHEFRQSLVEQTKRALSARFGVQPGSFTSFPIEKIVSAEDHVNTAMNGDTLTLRVDGTINIPPGIYIATQNVVIIANEIHFHPLSMIYAPGKKLILNATTIASPWLDVSGESATQMDGQSAGSIQVQLQEKNSELIGSLLFAAMGSHGRTMGCLSAADHPGNGGNGGAITLMGGTPLVNFKSMLSFPGNGGLLSCNGSDTKGNTGTYTPPVFVSDSHSGLL